MKGKKNQLFALRNSERVVTAQRGSSQIKSTVLEVTCPATKPRRQHQAVKTPGRRGLEELPHVEEGRDAAVRAEVEYGPKDPIFLIRFWSCKDSRTRHHSPRVYPDHHMTSINPRGMVDGCLLVTW